MMNLFPLLPVLEELKKYVNSNSDYRNIYIVSVQHLLETTGSLFEAIIDIGIKPENIYLLGKIYSTHNETKRVLQAMGINVFQNKHPEKFGTIRECLKKDVSQLWETIVPKLKEKDIVIILDDGGLAIKRVPQELFKICKFYGIEQTTFGLRYQEHIDHFPIIQVATSAAKKYLEPDLISRALINKLYKYLKKNKPNKVGIVGFGNIGKAVARAFGKKYKVMVFDENYSAFSLEISQFPICSSIEELIIKCDLIIGATGVDISNPNWENIINGNKTFISVSSSDIEFNSLLKKYSDQFSYHRYRVLDDLIAKLPNGFQITFYKGGTVANFNKSKESCPLKQIQLTRSLLFAAIAQALNNNINFNGKNSAIRLNPFFQKIIVNRWFSENPKFKSFYPQVLIDNFASESWIEKNSGGL